MLYVKDDGTIRLTRGDTARLTVPITNLVDGSEYTVKSDDTLYFTVKKKATDSDFLFQRKVNGSNSIHIRPEDTSELSFGKYKYDIQITTAAGDVYTVVEPSVFEVMEEIT
jgi:hypothetical protein